MPRECLYAARCDDRPMVTDSPRRRCLAYQLSSFQGLSLCLHEVCVFLVLGFLIDLIIGDLILAHSVLDVSPSRASIVMDDPGLHADRARTARVAVDIGAIRIVKLVRARLRSTSSCPRSDGSRA